MRPYSLMAIGASSLFTSPIALGGNIPAQGRTVTVPVTLSSNYPMVAVRIKGHTIPVLLDLGEDSALVLTQATLDGFGISASGVGYSVSDPKGNELKSRTFLIPRMKMGGATFVDVVGRVDVYDPTYDSAKVGQAGYIGPSLLHDYKFVLDYPRGRVTLIPQRRPDSDRAGCRGTAVPFLPQWKGLPVTQATTDLGDLTLIWDTGSPVSLIKDSLLRAGNSESKRDHVVTRQFRLSGRNFGPLELRAFEFSQPAGADGFIGTNFFAHHVVCVDLSAQRFLIGPSS